MKIYTKHQVKINGVPTGPAMWYMHDFETDNTLCIKNYDIFYKTLPYSIEGTVKENCFAAGNEVIDELEFHEVYDKLLDELQNYIP